MLKALGNLVYFIAPETVENGYKEVLQTFVNESSELVHIHVNGDEIVSTPTHPFYSPQRGWTRAVDLRAGDILVLSNGEYVVVEQEQHEILESPIKVYNFEVQDFHTYYVGENSVLVHNKCEETYIRYCNKDEAVNSSTQKERQGKILPHVHDGKTTKGAKWISELGHERKPKNLGKGHEYMMIIKTKVGAKKWLNDHSKLVEFDAKESILTNFVIVKNNEPGSYGIGADLIDKFNDLFKPEISYKKI